MRVAHGEVWSVKLDPVVGNEQAGTRPCIVVSSRQFNAMPIRHAIIVPLTTRNRGLPHHVAVADDGGLDYASWAMCEGVRSLSTQRFVRLIGTASDDTVDQIAGIVTIWLDRVSW